MITYILQFNYQANLNWTNLVDDDGVNIEFATKSSAFQVAKMLAADSDWLPGNCENWQILDSDGNIYPIEFWYSK